MYSYNDSLKFIPFLFNYNVHFSNVEDYSKLSLIMSVLIRNSYFFQAYYDSSLSISNLMLNLVFPLKVWFKMFVLETIDLNY